MHPKCLFPSCDSLICFYRALNAFICPDLTVISDGVTCGLFFRIRSDPRAGLTWADQSVDSNVYSKPPAAIPLQTRENMQKSSSSTDIIAHLGAFLLKRNEIKWRANGNDGRGLLLLRRSSWEKDLSNFVYVSSRVSELPDQTRGFYVALSKLRRHKCDPVAQKQS